jgi:hypothetical protein
VKWNYYYFSFFSFGGRRVSQAEKYLKSCLDQIACVGPSSSFSSKSDPFINSQFLFLNLAQKMQRREERKGIKERLETSFLLLIFLPDFESLMDSRMILLIIFVDGGNFE